MLSIRLLYQRNLFGKVEKSEVLVLGHHLLFIIIFLIVLSLAARLIYALAVIDEFVGTPEVWLKEVHHI